MPTYLVYTQWTEQGIRNIKESPKRLDLGKKKLKDLGGDIKAFYMTLGDYDSVRTKTVKAFTEDEYGRILGDMT
jgi:uncharacterized protein with GYD domain